ncbi:hypothetical protein EGW08_005801 [Elysia chlorotica]|uniref:Uncharacterized protein n=1 Tax=Elysia chlorotica TaxID=188477 RepID=A0A3S1A9Z3_ELYCH|nr:hypothetical protein EGW08_005801 [Elysia chlorotica]
MMDSNRKPQIRRTSVLPRHQMEKSRSVKPHSDDGFEPRTQRTENQGSTPPLDSGSSGDVIHHSDAVSEPLTKQTEGKSATSPTKSDTRDAGTQNQYGGIESQTKEKDSECVTSLPDRDTSDGGFEPRTQETGDQVANTSLDNDLSGGGSEHQMLDPEDKCAIQPLGSDPVDCVMQHFYDGSEPRTQETQRKSATPPTVNDTLEAETEQPDTATKHHNLEKTNKCATRPPDKHISDRGSEPGTEENDDQCSTLPLRNDTAESTAPDAADGFEPRTTKTGDSGFELLIQETEGAGATQPLDSDQLEAEIQHSDCGSELGTPKVDDASEPLIRETGGQGSTLSLDSDTPGGEMQRTNSRSEPDIPEVDEKCTTPLLRSKSPGDVVQHSGTGSEPQTTEFATPPTVSDTRAAEMQTSGDGIIEQKPQSSEGRATPPLCSDSSGEIHVESPALPTLGPDGLSKGGSEPSSSLCIVEGETPLPQKEQHIYEKVKSDSRFEPPALNTIGESANRSVVSATKTECEYGEQAQESKHRHCIPSDASQVTVTNQADGKTEPYFHGTQAENAFEPQVSEIELTSVHPSEENLESVNYNGIGKRSTCSTSVNAKVIEGNNPVNENLQVKDHGLAISNHQDSSQETDSQPDLHLQESPGRHAITSLHIESNITSICRSNDKLERNSGESECITLSQVIDAAVDIHFPHEEEEGTDTLPPLEEEETQSDLRSKNLVAHDEGNQTKNVPNVIHEEQRSNTEDSSSGIDTNHAPYSVTKVEQGILPPPLFLALPTVWPESSCGAQIPGANYGADWISDTIYSLENNPAIEGVSPQPLDQIQTFPQAVDQKSGYSSCGNVWVKVDISMTPTTKGMNESQTMGHDKNQLDAIPIQNIVTDIHLPVNTDTTSEVVTTISPGLENTTLEPNGRNTDSSHDFRKPPLAPFTRANSEEEEELSGFEEGSSAQLSEIQGIYLPKVEQRYHDRNMTSTPVCCTPDPTSTPSRYSTPSRASSPGETTDSLSESASAHQGEGYGWETTPSPCGYLSSSPEWEGCASPEWEAGCGSPRSPNVMVYHADLSVSPSAESSQSLDRDRSVILSDSSASPGHEVNARPPNEPNGLHQKEDRETPERESNAPQQCHGGFATPPRQYGLTAHDSLSPENEDSFSPQWVEERLCSVAAVEGAMAQPGEIEGEFEREEEIELPIWHRELSPCSNDSALSKICDFLSPEPSSKESAKRESSVLSMNEESISGQRENAVAAQEEAGGSFTAKRDKSLAAK